MIILGITDPFCQDNGACILVDGKLIAMIEEERLRRIKHAPFMPPDMAVEYCLKTTNKTLEDVDYIAVGFNKPGTILKRNLVKKVKDKFSGRAVLRSFKGEIEYYLIHKIHLSKINKYLEDGKTIFVRHHLAHAASSYYCSGFNEANIISLDGSGGEDSGILAYGCGTKIKILKTIERENSWGELYERITDKLGFQPHSGEGKVMGLAPYGEHNEHCFDFIDWSKPIPRINRREFEQFISNIPRREKGDEIKKQHKDLAAVLQFTLETVVIQMSQWLFEETGCKNLCMAGGTALNCSTNGKLIKQPHVENMFIQPASNDPGTALGAALWTYAQKTGGQPNITFNNAYWGPEYSNNEIEDVLKLTKVKYRHSTNIAKEIAELLVRNKIVGWFQGRMEIGPRALGARSIIANPIDPAMKDAVNNNVKFREPWRPFAPSILAEYANDFFENAYPSPFMIIAFDTKRDKLKEIPAAVHIDGTARPQTVEKETNPRYWEMINEFRKLTGVPAVLNTSFNVAGQPIVCSPRDAISTFFMCGMDYLAIGDYLISKE